MIAQNDAADPLAASVCRPSSPNRPLNPPNRRVRDPYARWCGRGGAARLSPIPIRFGAASPTSGLRPNRAFLPEPAGIDDQPHVVVAVPGLVQRRDAVIEGGEAEGAIDEAPEVLDEEWTGPTGERVLERLLGADGVEQAEHAKRYHRRPVVSNEGMERHGPGYDRSGQVPPTRSGKTPRPRRDGTISFPEISCGRPHRHFPARPPARRWPACRRFRRPWPAWPPQSGKR